MNKKVSHTIEQLASQRIPIFSERGAEKNQQVLLDIAVNGPMLKYDIAKSVRYKIPLYSTVSRRIDNLAQRGYLAVASKRLTLRGRQTEESMYGLTWKGFIAIITNEKARSKFIEILRRNPLLGFPEKELVLTLFEEMATEQEVQTIANSFLEGLLAVIPNLELLEDNQLPFLIISTLPKLRLPKDFKLSKIPKDAWELLDRPAILQAIKKIIVPLMKQYTEGIRATYLFFSAFDEFGEFLENLEPCDQPSSKIRAYVESRLKNLSEGKPSIMKAGEK